MDDESSCLHSYHEDDAYPSCEWDPYFDDDAAADMYVGKFCDDSQHAAYQYDGDNGECEAGNAGTLIEESTAGWESSCSRRRLNTDQQSCAGACPGQRVAHFDAALSSLATTRRFMTRFRWRNVLVGCVESD